MASILDLPEPQKRAALRRRGMTEAEFRAQLDEQHRISDELRETDTTPLPAKMMEDVGAEPGDPPDDA